MHAFGFIRGSKGNLTEFNLKHSDWHSSVFQIDKNVVVICGSKRFEWSCSAKCISSNSTHIFILSNSGIVTAFTKSSGTHRDLKLPITKSLAVNDEELFCIKEDSFVISVKLLDLDRLKIQYPIPVKIKSVACGAGFTLFLTSSGSVFSIGIGSRGQLGHSDLESKKMPELIAALQQVTVISIACGTWHSVCLTDTGDVYTWGSNEYGQLGLPSFNLERSRKGNNPTFTSDSCININAFPSLVDFPNDDEILSIACGSRHTACLSVTNTLYTFGWNGMGQLGFGTMNCEKSDKSPHLTASDKVNPVTLDCSEQTNLRIFCGQWSTIVQTESSSIRSVI